MEQQSSIACHYALLIGINAYAKTDSLKGCVNDVQSIKEVLDKQASPVVQTQILTATVDQTGDGITEDEKDRPTYENVVRALIEVSDRAIRGDCVYIHYSGHGTRIPPASKRKEGEVDGYHGSLALYLLADGEPGKVKELWGHQFAVQISRMVENGVVITIVLDCCFSTTLSQDNEDKDEATYDSPEIRHRPHQDDADNEDVVETEGKSSRYRQVDILPSWLIKPEGYTILVACGPYEEAVEFQPKRDNQFFGRLSYCLYEIFLKHGFSDKSRHIFNHLRSKFHNGLASTASTSNEGDSQEKRMRRSQMPILYGDKEQSFLGKASVKRGFDLDHPEMTTIPVEKPDDNTAVILQAGQAHGLFAGDKLHIFPNLFYAGSSSPQPSPLQATINQAGAVASTLDLTASDAVGFGYSTAGIRLSSRLRESAIYLDGLQEGLAKHSLYAHDDKTKLHVSL